MEAFGWLLVSEHGEVVLGNEAVRSRAVIHAALRSRILKFPSWCLGNECALVYINHYPVLECSE